MPTGPHSRRLSFLCVLCAALFLSPAVISPAFASSAAPAATDRFTAGKTAYDKKDWPAAIMALRPLAEQGDARAMVLLGNMYTHGYGVARDLTTAFSLYRRAAVAGNGEAMMVTGAMLQQGMGTSTNMPAALAWYERAARTGQQSGALFAGLLLYRGNNTGDANTLLPDPARAYQWLMIAARTGTDENVKKAAQTMADAIGKDLPADTRSEMDAAAAAFAPVSAADLGPAP